MIRMRRMVMRMIRMMMRGHHIGWDDNEDEDGDDDGVGIMRILKLSSSISSSH